MNQTDDLTGMGRLVQKDRRNLDFPMPKTATEVRSKFWSNRYVLDQGATPMCVGYAGWGWLSGGPVVNVPKASPKKLYAMAQDRDEWPGTDYEGTSTLGLMKSLKELGYVDAYIWATDAETVVSWLLTNGPVLVGTNWYREMFMPDRFQFLEVAGPIDGGHEYRLVGANRDMLCPDNSRGAVQMINSWGNGWGNNGRAWLSFKDLDRLIKEDGEAVTATEIKVP